MANFSQVKELSFKELDFNIPDNLSGEETIHRIKEIGSNAIKKFNDNFDVLQIA